MTGKLEDIRAEIDALDAQLRAGLLRRAELVAKIAAAKAANGDIGMPLRPMREMQQMQALRAWQEAEAPMLNAEGVVAIWREIIGMALSQQGGMTIYASPAAQATARAHFGASLSYENAPADLSELADNARAIGVLSLAEACPPPQGMAVFARLPLHGAAGCLCYGAQIDEDPTAMGEVYLVRRQAARNGDRVLFDGDDYVLVETNMADNDAIWGRYLTLESRLSETGK
jgi:chorismate mutase